MYISVFLQALESVRRREMEGLTFLFPGNVRELTGYRTATSIPSKFETVLHTGNKERNGFNTRVYRFNDSEVPISAASRFVAHLAVCFHRTTCLGPEIIM